jgi:1,4-alpha-glucan branching enzyme
MAIGRFMLVLHTHMPYVLSHGKSPHGTDWLFEAAAECYLPLLDSLDRLRQQGIKPRWTFNMTPILAEQLDDPSFKTGFEDYCQEKIDFAISDQKRFEASGDLALQGTAAMWQRWYTRALVQFKHQWDSSICRAFKEFQDEGFIELITCGATHGYFPLLGTDESVQAQVKVAVASHVKRFGKEPKGIWLPECAYRPAYNWRAPAGENPTAWARKGVDEFLAENGIDFFFVDSHMIRGGEPLGTYWQKFPQLAELFQRSKKLFTPPREYRSEYEHYAVASDRVIFARDPETTVKVWSGDAGYPGDPDYLEFHKHLPPGRLRYWRISENKSDLGAKGPYSAWRAWEKCSSHAKDLTGLLKSTLARYRGLSDREGTVVAMYDTELFGHWWWEGPEFLYDLAVHLHHDKDIECVTPSEMLAIEPPQRSVPLPEGSWGEGGYHSVWLNEDNHWTWEKLYPAEREMVTMAQTMAEGPAKPWVIQAARELLLAEASDWQFLISTWSARDYAEARFADHIERFNQLARDAKEIHQGLRPSTSQEAFLLECQEKDACFPDLDVSVWASLDRPLPQGAWHG